MDILELLMRKENFEPTKRVNHYIIEHNCNREEAIIMTLIEKIEILQRQIEILQETIMPEKGE